MQGRPRPLIPTTEYSCGGEIKWMGFRRGYEFTPEEVARTNRASRLALILSENAEARNVIVRVDADAARRAADGGATLWVAARCHNNNMWELDFVGENADPHWI